MADKHGRIATLVIRNVTDIIMKEIQDPIVSLCSINEVRMNKDNSFAHIYVSHLQKDKSKELVEFLNSRKGYIRQRLGKMMSIYKIPDLLFVEDNLYDKGAKIDSIIDSWKNK